MRELAKPKFGHDLESLWREALRLGYVSLEDAPSWLKMLSELQTGKHELRYPKPTTVYEVPTLNEETAIEAEVKRLLDQASSRNRASSQAGCEHLT